jgi:hypothetical protein
MEKIEMTKDDMLFLVETAIQLGFDMPDLIVDVKNLKEVKKVRKKLGLWMVENTIKDLNNNIKRY